jgi:hypothetical protein
MPERTPTPERLAELYDLLDPWGPGATTSTWAW